MTPNHSVWLDSHIHFKLNPSRKPRKAPTCHIICDPMSPQFLSLAVQQSKQAKKTMPREATSDRNIKIKELI